MPRLAPDGVRCKETRLTTGNMERKLLALYISEQKKERTQKYISSFALPISAVAVATGLGIGGYFIGMKISEADPLAKLKEWKDQTIGKYVTGEVVNPVTKELEPFSVEGATPNDEPVQNPVAGLPVIGSLFALGMRWGQFGINRSKIF